MHPKHPSDQEPLRPAEDEAAALEQALAAERTAYHARIRRFRIAATAGSALLAFLVILTLLAATTRSSFATPTTDAAYEEILMAFDGSTTSTTACAKSCGLPNNDDELRKLLTPEQYKIMKQNGTERPFANEYWNNHEEGIYVDRISGRPLFTSKDKFDSGTGWPSFTRPIHKDEVKEIVDDSHGMIRTEVRSKSSDSHLGHVFDDGPAPTRLRYCMNSASLKFIPVADLEKEGLAEYLPLFGEKASAPEGKGVTQQAVAMFGAGCFWGVEQTFRDTPGVLETAVGYAGGHTEKPTYKEVCTDTTGHAEVVRVVYDPAKVSYEQLLDVFWKNHNPTTRNRQGPDVGSQYRSVVFAMNDEQKKAAEASKAALDKSGRWKSPVVTEIVGEAPFHRAEEYHQQYLEKRGMKVCH